MTGIIVVFPNKDNATNIRNLLARGGMDVIGVCTTGAQAMHYADTVDDGIVVCGYRMKDMMYTQLREYLPESFEWLVLSAGILKDGRVDKILADPAEYVESKKFFSWERFFTAVLIDETKDTYLAYAKKKLNQAYLNDTIKSSVLGQMKKIQLDKKMDRKNQILLFEN